MKSNDLKVTTIDIALNTGVAMDFLYNRFGLGRRDTISVSDLLVRTKRAESLSAPSLKHRFKPIIDYCKTAIQPKPEIKEVAAKPETISNNTPKNEHLYTAKQLADIYKCPIGMSYKAFSFAKDGELITKISDGNGLITKTSSIPAFMTCLKRVLESDKGGGNYTTKAKEILNAYKKYNLEPVIKPIKELPENESKPDLETTSSNMHDLINEIKGLKRLIYSGIELNQELVELQRKRNEIAEKHNEIAEKHNEIALKQLEVWTK